MKDFLKDLISLPGLSGHEAPIRERIAERWQTLSDEIHTSPIGSLHALKRGNGAAPRSRVLIATHMDAIGLMVTGIDQGYLHITGVGGVDGRVLPGQRVIVHGRRELPGVVISPADRLLPDSVHGNPVPMEHLLVDTALQPEETAALVRPGDLVSFAQPPIEMGEDILAGHSLDNRASVAALTHALTLLQGREHAWDVWAVATVQEEVTLGGAHTSAFDLRPDVAIAVDVTFGDGPGSPEHLTFPLESGIPINWGVNMHRGVINELKRHADALEIPYQMEFAPRHSGTDGMALQIAADAVPTAVLSIPLRYMHTPVEMISLKDVRRVGRLLAEFIAGLPADWQPAVE
ncbi:MAG: M42 family metallopeptidase [Anaerolineales bacterium]